MQINKNNYESFFLDYHEGRLQAELVAELFVFLEENPELKEEFEGFENVSLPQEELPAMKGKEFLKKESINKENYTLYLTRHVDGSLSSVEINLLNEFLKTNPAYKDEVALFEKTKLVADLSIVYPGKASLKKPVPLFFSHVSWNYLAVAACILILLGVFFLRQERKNIPETAERSGQSLPLPAVQKIQEELDSSKQLKSTPFQIEKNIKSLTGKDPVSMFPQKLAQANQASHIKRKNRNQLAKSTLQNLDIQDEVQRMEPVEVRLSIAEQEMIQVKQKPVSQPTDYYTLTGESVIASEFPTIGVAFRDMTRKSIQKSIDDKPLANDLFSEQIPGKVKRIRFLSWCIEKVSGKKVDIQTTYSPFGELTAYHVSAGRLQFGKTFASR